MNEKCTLSFCCVSYNHAQFIEECVNSIWNQDYKDIEILALDDGSSDNSVKILNKLKNISPCSMTVITQQNSGNIGKNFNKLIKLARGEYITVLSFDDKLVENSIGYKINYLNINKNCAFTCDSKIIEIDSNGNINNELAPMQLSKINNPTVEQILKIEFEDIGAYYMQGAIYRKNIVDIIQGFDEDMICDDIVFRTKIARYILKHKEYSFKVFHIPGIYYRSHPNNVSKNSYRQIIGVADYMQRYWKNYPNPQKYDKWLEFALNEHPYKILLLSITHIRLRHWKYISTFLYKCYKYNKSKLRQFLIKHKLYKPKQNK